MRVTKDDCDCQTCGMAALKEKLLFYGWSELGPAIRKTLFKLLCVYIQTDVCDAASIENRQDIAFHLVVMFETTEHLEEYESETVKN